jgi:predicted PhzF superfamily epimerase YddE/YHI9
MISALSQLYGVVGFHVFYVPEMFRGKIYCRNFAPLYGIPEEAATGTSNASLAFYLFVTDTMFRIVYAFRVKAWENLLWLLSGQWTKHAGGRFVIDY